MKTYYRIEFKERNSESYFKIETDQHSTLETVRHRAGVLKHVYYPLYEYRIVEVEARERVI